MKNKTEQFVTNCLELGAPLTLLLENGYIVGSMMDECGSYPLLDFELDRIYLYHAIERKNKNYNHLFGVRL